MTREEAIERLTRIRERNQYYFAKLVVAGDEPFREQNILTDAAIGVALDALLSAPTGSASEDVIEIDEDGVVRALGPQSARDLAGLSEGRLPTTPEPWTHVTMEAPASPSSPSVEQVKETPVSPEPPAYFGLLDASPTKLRRDSWFARGRFRPR